MSDQPICRRCNRRAVYIGVSGAAELVCSRDCVGKCPGCLSTRIEPFVKPVSWSYWGFVPQTPEPHEMHCIDCGRVWAKETA